MTLAVNVAAIHAVLIATAAVCGMMLVLWLIHLPLRNASVVDPGWAGGLALVAVIYALMCHGYAPRVWLMAAMAVVWGLRLSMYLLFTRVIGHPEEGRYVQLRKEWGSNIELKFLVFFEFQALLCVVLSAPFLLPALNPRPALSIFECAGAILWVIALAGEVIADSQLNAFKKNPANRGKTCQAGLWNYSRHPNYFFEWLIWMAYAVFALGSSYGYVAFFSPALMLYFLYRVTGIPATEAQALRSRGEEYRRYQETTSEFILWFKKQ